MRADGLRVSDCHVDVNGVVIRHAVDDVTQRTEQTTLSRSITESRRNSWVINDVSRNVVYGNVNDI